MHRNKNTGHICCSHCDYNDALFKVHEYDSHFLAREDPIRLQMKGKFFN